MENKTLGIIFTAGIAILLGVFLISIIADQTASVTDLTTVSDEALDISGARLYTHSAVTRISNETVTGLAVAGDQLSVAGLLGISDCTVLAVKNVTDAADVPATNYTLNASCNLKSTDAANSWTGENVNITYTYKWHDNWGAVNASYHFTLAGAVTTGTWKADYPECAVSTIILKNQSGSAMTLTAHYSFVAGTAVMELVNTLPLNQSTSNSTTVSYDYCSADYVTGWGQTVTNLIVGFFAIALVGAALFFFFRTFEAEGIKLDN